MPDTDGSVAGSAFVHRKTALINSATDPCSDGLRQVQVSQGCRPGQHTLTLGELGTGQGLNSHGSDVGDKRQEAERPANNRVEMKCLKREMRCSFLSINELGRGHVGWPSNDTLAIRSWTDKGLVADSLPHSGSGPACVYCEARAFTDTFPVKDCIRSKQGITPA